VLVTDSYLNNIYQISLTDGSTQALFVSRTDGNNPIAVAYDPTTRDVYYSDNGVMKFISKYSLVSGTFERIYEDMNGNFLY
jgi:hypothetical protein